MWFQREGRIYVSLPGVPYEMKALMTEQVLPRLAEYFRDQMTHILHRTLVTAGIGESLLAELIAHIAHALPAHLHLAYLPRPGMVRLRLSTYGLRTKEETEAELDKAE